MDLNINLFVHGVPMGQKIWGPKGDDQSYISSFYGPKWDAPEVMKIDIMTFGGIPYCYYSYIKGQNVFDSQGRAGSYFALTLRINAFYADVNNLYHILKAAYDKICVGLCIQESKDSAKFTLSDFQNIDKELKDLENRILGYISEFSIGNDLVDLNGVNINSQAGVCSINLHECSNAIAIKAIKQYGKIMVSPWYLSERAAKAVAHYKDEMQATSQKAQQEIQLQKQTSQQKIDEIVKQTQEEIASIKKESQAEANVIKEQCKQQLTQVEKDCDRRILEINNNYANANEIIRKLNSTIHDKDKEIAESKAMYRNKVKELQIIETKYNDLIRKTSPMELEGNQHDNNRSPIFNNRFGWFIGYKKWTIIGISCLIILLLVCVILARVLQNQKDVTPLPIRGKQMKTVINQSTEDSASQKKSICIIINGLENEKDSVDLGKAYTITISGENDDTLNGKFTSTEFDITDNSRIMAKRAFKGQKGCIKYMVNDSVLASRFILIRSK